MGIGVRWIIHDTRAGHPSNVISIGLPKRRRQLLYVVGSAGLCPRIRVLIFVHDWCMITRAECEGLKRYFSYEMHQAGILS